MNSGSTASAALETARYHHEPELAGHHSQIIASVQITNLLRLLLLT